MRFHSGALFLFTALAMPQHVQAGDPETYDPAMSDLEWVGVDVLTDGSQPERISQLTQAGVITPGEKFPMTVETFTERCARVEHTLGRKPHGCFPVAWSPGKAVLIVELDAPLASEEPVGERLDCADGRRVDGHVIRAYNELEKARSEDIISSREGVTGEAVTEVGVLVYDNESVQQFATDLRTALFGEEQQLLSAAESCDADTRLLSAAVLPFTGRPADVVKAGITGLQDRDERVRNQSSRNLALFAEFLSEDAAKQVFAKDCAVLESGTFHDRNKALATIHSLAAAGRLTKSHFPGRCLADIQFLSETTRSPQLGGYADLILQQLDSD